MRKVEIMQVTEPIPVLLKRLWRHISPRRRSQLGLLLVLMILAAFAEMLSIGMVLPFLGVLTSAERVFSHPAMQPFIHALALKEPHDLLFPLTITFGVAALLAGVMRLLLLWSSTWLSFATGADLGISIYRRTLYQPYSVHVSRNSSAIIDGISVKVDSVIYDTLIPLLVLISSCAMLVFILVALMTIDTAVALAAFGGFGAIYFIVVGLSRKQLLADSRRVATESTHVIKALQEGLGGIRDILIDGTQSTYCQIYRDADISLRRAQGRTNFITQSPRFAMESLGMLFIALLAYFLAREPHGLAKAIPVLGALALGAQRLLPVLQQAYAAWSSIGGAQAALHDALVLLDQPLPAHVDHALTAPIRFEETISLKRISFRYSPEGPFVLSNLNLTIAKGSRVGFIGRSGCGKSTLLDIVMSLLDPTAGALEVDGQPVTPANRRAWQAHIAHVPQAIFVSDATIEENIAFGVPPGKIDLLRVRQAAKQAQIADVIESWPDQYRTFVGERGIRLSGGQRQRIGIARALYKNADVIIFDEATSALDNETEKAVMQSLESLSRGITILLVAHRISTLAGCNQIVKLESGEVMPSFVVG